MNRFMDGVVILLGLVLVVLWISIPVSCLGGMIERVHIRDIASRTSVLTWQNGSTLTGRVSMPSDGERYFVSVWLVNETGSYPTASKLMPGNYFQMDLVRPGVYEVVVRFRVTYNDVVESPKFRIKIE